MIASLRRVPLVQNANLGRRGASKIDMWDHEKKSFGPVVVFGGTMKAKWECPVPEKKMISY